MIYRLKELKGDTIAVPQLVFAKLGIAEEYNVRVALYVLATGITDPEKTLRRPEAPQQDDRRERPGLLGRCRAAGTVRGEQRPGRRAHSPCPHDLGRDRCRFPHRPHDLQPHRLRPDQLRPSPDPRRDGEAGPLLPAGGLLPRGGDALRGLCGQQGQAHHGCRQPRAESLAGRGRGDRRAGRCPSAAAGPPGAAGAVRLRPAGPDRQRPDPGGAARPSPGGTRSTATTTLWCRRPPSRPGPSGTCGTGTASSRPGTPRGCAPSTTCGARWPERVPAGTSGWTAPNPAGTISSRTPSAAVRCGRKPTRPTHKELLCVPDRNFIRTPCARSPCGGSPPGPTPRMPGPRRKPPSLPCAMPRTRCGCGASGAHWPGLPARTAPRQPPLWHRPDRPSPTCWPPAAALPMHWNPGSPARSVRTPAALRGTPAPASTN